MIDLPAILQTLTRDQHTFVTSMSRRIELVAGPGTGKTYAIAARCAWLITQRGVFPSEILIAVFSNAAKDAISRRLRLWGFEEMPRITTLHGYALGYLYAYWDLIGVKGHEVASNDDIENVLRDLLYGHKRRKDLARIGIRRAREVMTLWDAGSHVPIKAEALLVRAIVSRLRARGLIPLGSVIRSVVQVHAELADAGSYQGIRFVVCDEAHDITAMERAYVDCIAETAGAGLMMIHDPRQRIFEWRGSHPLDAHIEDGEQLSLTITHRFGPEIARIANTIAFKAGEGGYGGSAPLRSVLPSSSVVLRDTAGFVGGAFDDPIPYSDVGFAITGRSYNNFAVLCRTNREVDAIRSMWPGTTAMTVHQAKGHEWDEVVVLTSARWPGFQPKDEDWRILFVAVTRARRALKILHTERSHIPALIEELPING